MVSTQMGAKVRTPHGEGGGGGGGGGGAEQIFKKWLGLSSVNFGYNLINLVFIIPIFYGSLYFSPYVGYSEQD